MEAEIEKDKKKAKGNRLPVSASPQYDKVRRSIRMARPAHAYEEQDLV